mgnify:FL=1
MPLFYWICMIKEQELIALIKEEIAQRQCFMVHFSVGVDHNIRLVIDKIEGIKLKELTEISRALEGKLIEDDVDFDLTVTSPGVGEPLQVKDQYVQNVGRKLKVVTQNEEEFEGRLVNFENDVLTLEWKTREPKPAGKGKRTVTKQQTIDLANITQARVQVEFK